LCSATALATASILRVENLAFRAGARPDPVGRLAAIEAVADRRRDRRVADTHLADAQEIRAAGDRLHAEGHGRRAILLVHRGFLRDVGGRIIEREVEDLEAEIVGDADLVDGGAAGGEVFDHLRRDARRERRDAALDDAVIAGEDRDERPRDGRRTAGPGGEPLGEPLEPSERARRLRQLRIALPDRSHRCLVRARQVRQQVAEIVKGKATGHIMLRSGILWRVFCPCPIHDGWLQATGSRRNAKEKRLMTRNPDSAEGLAGQTMRATGFLSRLPYRPAFGTTPRRRQSAMTPAPFRLPASLIAAGPALLLLVLSLIGLPVLMTAAFVTLALVAVTGALHEDGLGDVADGFGGGATKEAPAGHHEGFAHRHLWRDRRRRKPDAARRGTWRDHRGAWRSLRRNPADRRRRRSRAAIVWFWASLPNARGEGVAQPPARPTKAPSAWRRLPAWRYSPSSRSPRSASSMPPSPLLLFALAALQGFSRLCTAHDRRQTGDTLGACQQIVEIMLLTGLALGISIPT
jgi:adenosylcobinamide-GDP ribazoletransferase